MYNNIACPLCVSIKRESIYFVNQYQIAQCLGCKLVFVSPQPAKDNLEDYYNNEYSINLKNYLKIYKPRAYRKFKRLVKKINNFKERDNLIEIGSSYGFFLDVARRDGWKVTGIELDKNSSEYARNRLKIDVFNGKVEEFQSNEKYDVACMWHTLEHDPKPLRTLKTIHRLLKDNGLFFATMPNIDSLIAKINGKYWEWLIPPAHLFYFSTETIKKILDKAGFTTLQIKTSRGGDAKNIVLEFVVGLVKRSKFDKTFRKLCSTKSQKSKNEKSYTSFDRSNILYRIAEIFSFCIYILLYPLYFLLTKLNLGEEIFVVACKKNQGKSII